MQTLADEIKTFEEALKLASVPIDEVLRQASVDRSTWTRWKNGSVRGARYTTVERVRRSVSAALAGAEA